MKGILMKPDMVKAIVEGRKTQTRRAIKPQPSCDCEQRHFVGYKDGSVNFFYEHHNTPIHYKPRYQIGEVLYIKEGWYHRPDGEVSYKADDPNAKAGEYWTPLFMPEWAARHFIRITGVRAERLRDISLEDVEREGMKAFSADKQYGDCMEFVKVWDTTNKSPYDWNSNPWIFAYSFKREVK